MEIEFHKSRIKNEEVFLNNNYINFENSLKFVNNKCDEVALNNSQLNRKLINIEYLFLNNQKQKRVLEKSMQNNKKENSLSPRYNKSNSPILFNSNISNDHL